VASGLVAEVTSAMAAEGDPGEGADGLVEALASDIRPMGRRMRNRGGVFVNPEENLTVAAVKLNCMIRTAIDLLTQLGAGSISVITGLPEGDGQGANAPVEEPAAKRMARLERLRAELGREPGDEEVAASHQADLKAEREKRDARVERLRSDLGRAPTLEEVVQAAGEELTAKHEAALSSMADELAAVQSDRDKARKEVAEAWGHVSESDTTIAELQKQVGELTEQYDEAILLRQGQQETYEQRLKETQAMAEDHR